MAKIQYTENFKKKVRELHGNSFNDHLENGSITLKPILESYSKSKMV